MVVSPLTDTPAPEPIAEPPAIVAPVTPLPEAPPLVRERSRALAWLSDRWAIAALVTVGAVLRAFHLSDVAGQLIGDENWYVQDARVIDGLPVLLHNLPQHPLSGIDPNTEHPPLAKVIIAGFIKLFGDKEIAYRIPSVILGTLSIWFLYELVLKLGGTKKVAWFAAFVLAFENMSFVHDRIAMLEVYMISLSILGAWLYFSGRHAMAGVVFAVATMCKINGLLGMLGVFTCDAILIARAWQKPSWKSLRPWLETGGFFLAMFLLGLGALDNYFTEFHTPFAHLSNMLHYHSVVRTRAGPPIENESTPLQWWLNDGGMTYFIWTINGPVKSQSWLFKAAMNEYVIIAAPVAMIWVAQRVWAERSKLGAFAIAWFVTAYGPVLSAWLFKNHISYIYYMMPSVPAFAIAIAFGVMKLPRTVQLAYAFVVLCAFFNGYPIHQF